MGWAGTDELRERGRSAVGKGVSTRWYLWLEIGLPVTAVAISIFHILIITALHRIHAEIHEEIKGLREDLGKLLEALNYGANLRAERQKAGNAES